MKKELCVFSVALMALILALSQSGGALTLDQYLSAVQSKNKNFQSYAASTAAADVRYDQGDLDLSPILTAQGNYLDDKSMNFSTEGFLSHEQVRQYGLGVAKKFSTGTQAAIQATSQSIVAEGVDGANTPFDLSQHSATLGVSLSQSLWKDFFGHATRLRWQRESAERQQEKSTYDLQAKQSLIDAESAFWDLLYLQQELSIRQASLERSKKIESWVKRRFGNGIGDKADELTAQSLVATREFQLLQTEDNLTAAQKNLIDQMESSKDQPTPTLEANLEKERPLDTFVIGQSGRIVRLDTYLAALDAQTKAVTAEESLDKVRPDVVLQGAYKTNGYDTTDSGAVNKMTNKDYPVTSVGLAFTWALDWDAKNAVRDSAKQDALAAKLKKERKLLESETAWTELNRRHAEMGKQIQSAAQLSQIQMSKAKAESEKLSKGRTITSDVVNAEQDAAEAELNLTRLKAEQRKLESQGRLFVRIEGGL